MQKSKAQRHGKLMSFIVLWKSDQGHQPDADIVVNVEEKTDREDLESGTNMPDTPKKVTDTVNSV